MDLDFNKLLPRISESDLRKEIKRDIFKSVPNPAHVLYCRTLGINRRAQKPG